MFSLPLPHTIDTLATPKQQVGERLFKTLENIFMAGTEHLFLYKISKLQGKKSQHQEKIKILPIVLSKIDSAPEY